MVWDPTSAPHSGPAGGGNAPIRVVASRRQKEKTKKKTKTTRKKKQQQKKKSCFKSMPKIEKMDTVGEDEPDPIKLKSVKNNKTFTVPQKDRVRELSSFVWGGNNARLFMTPEV